jgi:hypothetical protein
MSTKRTLVKGGKIGLQVVNGVVWYATVIGAGCVAGAIGTILGGPSVGKSLSHGSSIPIEKFFKKISEAIDDIDEPL